MNNVYFAREKLDAKKRSPISEEKINSIYFEFLSNKSS